MRRFVPLLLAVAATPAMAQENVYVGLGLGLFDYSETTSSLIIATPLNVGQLADEVQASKIFGGFEINDYFTLEISYGQTHKIRQSVTETVDLPPELQPPAQVDVEGALATKLTTTTLTAIGQYPFDWGVILGGIGYYSSENDYSDRCTILDPDAGLSCGRPEVIEGSFSDNGLSAKLGIEWRFGRFGTRYAVRLEYDWQDIDFADGSTLGLAFSYGF